MPPLSLLIKPASSNCNMKCKYCFYRSVSENRNVKLYGIMSLNTLKAIVSKALKSAEYECTFIFQGGEPTLAGLYFFKELMELEKKYNVQKINIRNVLQTNGILLDESWAVFLHDNNFLVGVSLDGPKNINDLHRTDIFGKSTYNRVIKAISILNKYEVEYNILSVVTSGVARHAKSVYDFFIKGGFSYIQFIQCLDPINEGFGKNKYSLTPYMYGKFLNDVFNKWYQDVLNGNFIDIRYFSNLINIILGERPEACEMNGFCSCQYAIEADGGVYPCDFYAIDKWYMGNINNMDIRELFYSGACQTFLKTSININEKCKDCKWLNLCRGGCRRHKESFINERISLNYFCESYKMFFEKSYNRLEIAANIFVMEVPQG